MLLSLLCNCDGGKEVKIGDGGSTELCGNDTRILFLSVSTPFGAASAIARGRTFFFILVLATVCGFVLILDTYKLMS